MTTKFRYRPAWNAIGIAVAGALIPVVRYAVGAPLARGVYAEDGAVFFKDAVAHGPGSLFAHYAGYGHLVPRVFALVVAQLPTAWFAAAVVVFCAAVYGACAAIVAICATRVGLRGLPVYLAALAFVLLPGFGLETILTLCNLQWVLLYTGAWLLCARIDRTAAYVALGVIAATSPVMLLLAPIVFVRAPRTWIVKAAVAVGCGIAYHAMCVVFGPASMTNPQHRGLNVSFAVVRFMVLSSAEAMANFSPRAVSLGVFALQAAVLLLWFVLAKRRDDALRFAVSGAVVLAVCSVVTGGAATRYATVAMALAVGAGALCLVERRRTTVSVLAAVLIVPWVLSPPLDDARKSVPSWRTTVAHAKAACDRGAEEARVTIAPRDWLHHGELPRVALPCDRV